MKILVLFLALLPLGARAELKWETTRKATTYKEGTGVYRLEFPFKNTGKTLVSISNIQTGCACCTTAKVKKWHYAPGESGVVQMMVDVRGKNVPLAKSVMVQYADNAAPTPLIVDIKTVDGKTVSVPRWNFGIHK